MNSARFVNSAIVAEAATLNARDRAAFTRDLSRPPAISSPILCWLTRERRVLFVLAAIWVLNLFDLGFTLTEANSRHFQELNPVAASLLDFPIALMTYKCSLVLIGSWLLLRYRQGRIAELGCWFLLMTYSYVGVRWSHYYEDVHLTLNDPCVFAEPAFSCAMTTVRP